VRLRNTGGRRGREVVQVYASRPDSALERPVRWLAGFAAAEADPGEEVAVTVTVPIRRQVLEIQQIPLHAGADPGEGVTGVPGDLGPDVIEVVLSEERPVVEVVDVSVVPVERVRVIRETRSVQVPVSAQVGREVVDVVTDVGKGAVAGPGTTVVPGSTPGS